MLALDSATFSSRSRPTIIGKVISSLALQYRNSDPADKKDGRTGELIYRYQRIEDVPWATFAQHPDNSVRIIVQSNPNMLPLDVTYVPRESKRLLVGLHGAEFRNTDLPKFQFVTSFKRDRQESLLFISDSTHLHRLGEIGICWYAGSPGIDISIGYSNLIRSLMRATAQEEVMLVGHSAGGMGAIKIGSRIPNSRAIAVNAQFSATYYPKWSLTPLQEFAFPRTSSIDDMLEQYADRFDLTHCLNKRVNGSTVSWFSHQADSTSFGDYPNFESTCHYFGLQDPGGRTEAGDVVVKCNWDPPANAHALPGVITPYIALTLGEQTDFELKPMVDVDLRWER